MPYLKHFEDNESIRVLWTEKISNERQPFENLSGLDGLSTVIKLRYVKEMLITVEWKLTNTKFGL